MLFSNYMALFFYRLFAIYIFVQLLLLCYCPILHQIWLQQSFSAFRPQFDQFLFRKQCSQFVHCFLRATTEGSNYYGYDRYSISRPSFSPLKSKLLISCKIISPFRVNIFFRRTCHIANPNLPLVFQLEYKVQSSCCLQQTD